MLTFPPHVYRGSPADLSMPFTSGMSSGPDRSSALSKASTITGAKTTYTSRVHPNSGFVSNLFCTNRIGLDIECLDRDDVYIESLIFAGPPRNSDIKPDMLVYPIKSLYTLNQYLDSDEGARLYGAWKYGEDILKAWRFVGCLANEPPDFQIDKFVVPYITLICHGRVRMPELSCALKSGPEQGRTIGTKCNEGDYLWLIGFKRRRPNALKTALEQANEQVRKRLGMDDDNAMDVIESAVVKSDIPKYSWTFRIVATRDRCRPDMAIYTNPDGTIEPDSEYYGVCRYLARVSEVQGDRDSEPAGEAAAARNAIMGGPNWKADLNRLKKIVVQFGIF